MNFFFKMLLGDIFFLNEGLSIKEREKWDAEIDDVIGRRKVEGIFRMIIDKQFKDFFLEWEVRLLLILVKVKRYKKQGKEL